MATRYGPPATAHERKHMKPRQGASENFAMISIQELMDAVLEATGERRLQLRDSAVVLGLVAHMNWRTGRCNVKGTVLAEQLKMKQPDVAGSIKRRKVEGLLTRAVDPVWARIREAAQQAAASEPVLAGTLHATILSQPRFEGALSYHLARLVGTTEVPAALIRQIFDEALPGQLCERVTDRPARHPEPLRQVRLDESGTRGESPFQDLVAQLVRDRLPELLVCEHRHRWLPWTGGPV